MRGHSSEPPGVPELRERAEAPSTGTRSHPGGSPNVRRTIMSELGVWGMDPECTFRCMAILVWAGLAANCGRGCLSHRLPISFLTAAARSQRGSYRQPPNRSMQIVLLSGEEPRAPGRRVHPRERKGAETAVASSATHSGRQESVPVAGLCHHPGDKSSSFGPRTRRQFALPANPGPHAPSLAALRKFVEFSVFRSGLVASPGHGGYWHPLCKRALCPRSRGEICIG